MKELPFRRETLFELSLVDRTRALAILKRGRSKGNPSLECKDFLTSTVKIEKIQKSHFLPINYQEYVKL